MEGGNREINVQLDFLPVNGLALFYVIDSHNVQDGFRNFKEMQKRFGIETIRHLYLEGLLVQKSISTQRRRVDDGTVHALDFGMRLVAVVRLVFL